jgi:hypothetical protein
MLLVRAFAILLPVIFITPAEAYAVGGEPTWDMFRVVEPVARVRIHKARRHARRHKHHATRRHHRRGNLFDRYAKHRGGGGSVDTSGLPGPLVVILDKIKVECPGFKIISTYRPGAVVAGTNRTSLHALWKAADFEVDKWTCAFKQLAGFPGGVSTDPTRVHHIHVSYSQQSHEWGARFAHHRPRHAVRHYAARHRSRRYARLH